MQVGATRRLDQISRHDHIGELVLQVGGGDSGELIGGDDATTMGGRSKVWVASSTKSVSYPRLPAIRAVVSQQ
jgi:hypothetical protein